MWLVKSTYSNWKDLALCEFWSLPLETWMLRYDLVHSTFFASLCAVQCSPDKLYVFIYTSWEFELAMKGYVFSKTNVFRSAKRQKATGCRLITEVWTLGVFLIARKKRITLETKFHCSQGVTVIRWRICTRYLHQDCRKVFRCFGHTFRRKCRHDCDPVIRSRVEKSHRLIINLLAGNCMHRC